MFIYHFLVASKLVVWHNAKKKKTEDKRRNWTLETLETQLQDFSLLIFFSPWSLTG